MVINAFGPSEKFRVLQTNAFTPHLAHQSFYCEVFHVIHAPATKRMSDSGESGHPISFTP